MSLSHIGFAVAAEADRFSLFVPMRSGPGRLVAAGADHLELGHVDRRLALEDAALHVLGGVRLGVLLGEVHPLHDGRALGRVHAQDAALLAAVLARENDDRVAFLDVRLVARGFFLFD